MLFRFPKSKALPSMGGLVTSTFLCSPSLAIEIGPFVGRGGAGLGSGVILFNDGRGERLQIASPSGELISGIFAHCCLARGDGPK